MSAPGVAPPFEDRLERYLASLDDDELVASHRETAKAAAALESDFRTAMDSGDHLEIARAATAVHAQILEVGHRWAALKRAVHAWGIGYPDR